MDLTCIIQLPNLMGTHARIQELTKRINELDYQYYVLGVAGTSDQEYDFLFKELQALERTYPELDSANSPTKRVGGLGVSGFKKIQHARRMLSLDNTYTSSEVLDFFGTQENVVVEPKIDGLSLKVVYKEGALVQAITRGNGQEGDDVTANARTIRTLPLVLSDPVSIEVIGEVYMTHTVFNELNEALETQDEEPFANARNAASGALKLKNPSEVAKRKLSFVVHGCLTELPGIMDHYQLIAQLEYLGFQSTLMLPTLEGGRQVTCEYKLSDIAALASFIKEADANRQLLNLDTDGLVFKIADLRKQRELGEGTRAPKWAVAYKYPPERKVTSLLGITIQIGKSGRITPVAELKPVALSGTIVRRASLCNQDEIERLGISAGDDVYVEKSADIIPKVAGLAEKKNSMSKHYVFPEKCPCCSTNLVRHEGEVDFYCPNEDCDEQVFARLRYATGKQALDIDGCGEVMVRELMRHGVHKLSDLFMIRDLHFLKPAARTRFLEGREYAKNQPFWRKLMALGVDGLGQVHCQDIAAHWTTLLAALDASDKLKQVLGDSVYINFTSYLKEHADELEVLAALGVVFEADEASIGALSGKVFVITGTLVSGSRDEVIRRIEKAGGMVKPSVSKKVHYLVQGADAGRAKTEKAASLAVTVIAEQQLYEMLGVPMPKPAAVDPYREF